MSLRQDDHLKTLAFLGRMEREGLKALQAPVFSGYGGHGYGPGGGAYGGGLYTPWQPGAKYDYLAAAGDLWRNSAVAICLAWYGDNFPEPELRVMRREADGTESPVPDHPLVRLLRRPNPRYGWHALAKSLVMGYRCDGNAHWLVARGADGMPVQLWAIPHNRIWPRWSSSGTEYIGWYDYQIDGRTIRLELDQVVHFRDGIDPHNDRNGLAALKSNIREVCTDNEGSSFTASIMRNMGVVGYAISPANPNDHFGDKEDRDEIADSFVGSQGGENRGRPAVTSLGVKVDRIGMSPEELTLDKIMRMPEARICAAMRLPAQVVGLICGEQSKTFANYEQARRAAYEDGIIPMQKEVAQVINDGLMPLLGDPATERFEFDYSKVQCLSESEDARFTRYGDAYQKNKILTLNQTLKALGQEGIGPAGDKYADGSSLEEGPTRPPAPLAPPAAGEEQGVELIPAQGDEDDGASRKALLARVDAVMARAEEITASTMRVAS